MNVRRLNWPLWVGFLLTLAAFITYTSVFVYYPVTRDFPWANLLIFAVAVVLLIIGLRRGFASDRPHPTRSKIVSSIVGVLGFAVFALFIFAFFVAGKWLPASNRAPQVGERAPEFTLPDANGKQVSLTQLLSTPVNGLAPKGVLLIFYRGHW
jgi:ABC-type dipeptide/oligopeptide/nickel transport system permease component